MDQILEEEANEHSLEWDKGKNSRVTFSDKGPIE